MVAFPNAWRLRYAETPAKKSSSPRCRGELTKRGSTFCVRDHVKRGRDGIHVREVAKHGVRGGQLVSRVSHGLPLGREGHPSVGPLGHGSRGVSAHVLGKCLVEPQIVPPAHGDEIAKPHVREFVEHNDGAELELRVGWASAEQQPVL